MTSGGKGFGKAALGVVTAPLNMVPVVGQMATNAIGGNDPNYGLGKLIGGLAATGASLGYGAAGLAGSAANAATAGTTFATAGKAAATPLSFGLSSVKPAVDLATTAQAASAPLSMGGWADVAGGVKQLQNIDALRKVGKGVRLGLEGLNSFSSLMNQYGADTAAPPMAPDVQQPQVPNPIAEQFAKAVGGQNV